MKIFYDGKEIYELSEVEKKIIENEVSDENLDYDLMRRFQLWIESEISRITQSKADAYKKAFGLTGKSVIPEDTISLMEIYADRFPVKIGNSDLYPITCKIRETYFIFSVLQQKIFRKANWNPKTGKHKEKYLAEEKRNYEEKFKWIIENKYQRCYDRLKREWLPKLQNRGISDIPQDVEELADLIFSQPDYQTRWQADAEKSNNLMCV